MCHARWLFLLALCTPARQRLTCKRPLATTPWYHSREPGTPADGVRNINDSCHCCWCRRATSYGTRELCSGGFAAQTSECRPTAPRRAPRGPAPFSTRAYRARRRLCGLSLKACRRTRAGRRSRACEATRLPAGGTRSSRAWSSRARRTRSRCDILAILLPCPRCTRARPGCVVSELADQKVGAISGLMCGSVGALARCVRQAVTPFVRSAVRARVAAYAGQSAAYTLTSHSH